MVSSDTVSSTGTTQTITDMMGNTVQIPSSIDRIADFWPAHNEVLLMLGVGDKIVATTPVVQTIPFFKKIYPRIATMPAPWNSQTSVVTMEDLISTNPDIAIVSTGANESTEKIIEAGIPVVSLTFLNFEDMEKCILLTGTMLGEKEKKKAEEYNAYLESKLTEIKSLTSNIPQDKKIRVLHLSSLSPIKADGKNTLISSWINVAGGVNAAEDGLTGNGKPVTIEQIQTWNPDMIIVGGTMKDKDTIMNDPLWKNLKAVQDGKVIINPKGIFSWDRYGAEEALQIQWAAQTLNPDLFPNLDIKDEVKKFYTEFFDYDLTNDEIEGILNPQA